jgi:hypothetical protein
VSQSLTSSIGVELLLVNIHYFLWILLFCFFPLTSDGTAGCKISDLPIYCFTYYLKSLYQNLTPIKRTLRELYDSFQPLL